VTTARVLVAGVGNVFLGDDGFGCEVARRLAAGALPEGVQVADFGIRGFDLGFALLDGYEVAILVDAMRRGGPPGTLYVVEPCLTGGALSGTEEALCAHDLGPAKALEIAGALGAQLGLVRVLGCEPGTLGPEGEGRIGLSVPVAAVIDDAARLALELAAEARAALRARGRRSTHA
jgi:hydrogenase maturation protease